MRRSSIFIVTTSILLSFTVVCFGQGTSSQTFSIANRGGVSLQSSGSGGSVAVGYSRIEAGTGSTTPSGLAIFGFRQNNILVTEAGVPAASTVQSARIYAEIAGAVNTGLAIANPTASPVTISFFFTNATGNLGNGTATIPANGQIAAFLNEAPFNGPSSFSGAFTFSSTSAVAVIALRGLTNERGEFLITTLPVADLLASPAAGSLTFPHFADGGGWTTQVVLVNPGDATLAGNVQFLDSSGQPSTVSVNSQAASSFSYSIPPRSSQKLQTSGTGTGTVSGSVRAVPTTGSATPSGLAIFSFRTGGATVAEAGVPALPAGTAFRLYAEAAGGIQTGLAITNLSSSSATVSLELTRLDGSSTGLQGSLTIAANGQRAVFLNEVPGFTSLSTTSLQGVLRISSQATIAVTGLRGRYNERGHFLITTTPPVDESAATSTSPVYFPHIVDSGGYTTQFILFSGRTNQSASGTIRFVTQAGAAMNLGLSGSGTGGTGGGTGGTGGGTGGTGGGTGGSGAAIDCLDRTIYTSSGTAHLEYNVTGAFTGTSISDVVGTQNVQFEGQNAAELFATTTTNYTGQQASITRGRQYGILDGTDVVVYGQTFEVSQLGFTGTGKSVNTPPSRDKRYSLGVGESATQTISIATTITFGSLPPISQTSTQTSTVKYLGRESVTVPAGTFDTCKFESTVSGSTGSTIQWEAVGRGIAVKTTTSGTEGITMELRAGSTVNGTAIR